MPPRKKTPKRVTRYTHDDAHDPATPETGHTALLPGEEQVVEIDVDNGWVGGLEVGKLDSGRTVVVDLDPAVDPVLVWAGKRSRRHIPVLPLQRNEVVSESRIAQIIARVREAAVTGKARQGSLFADLEKELRESEKGKRVEFYTHEEGWKNKLICGDSLPVMESMLRYEGLAGKVQMVYIDPPYGIKYDSNFQQRIDSTRNDQADRADDALTIRAFRDTWALGIHSYLSYLRDRLYLARELLAESGSVFVQMNEQNVHLVRLLMDEVFGAENYVSTVVFSKTTGFSATSLSGVYDCLVWYGREKRSMKQHILYQRKPVGVEGSGNYRQVELPDSTRRQLTSEELRDLDALPSDWRVFRIDNLCSQGAAAEVQPFTFQGVTYYPPPNSHWKTTNEGLQQLVEAGRVAVSGKRLYYVRYADDFPMWPLNNIWLDTGRSGFGEEKLFSVQTHSRVPSRCIAMTTDPGDLVFDPTCGSGTTALAAESLGRRWITCDTSRVAMNVARQRLLSAVFEHFTTRNSHPSSGFWYETAGRVTLKSIAHGLEPEQVELVDKPVTDKGAIRVCGPLEVLTLGRYSADDWQGRVEGLADAVAAGDYINVICRLYRAGCERTPSAGLVHAVFEAEGERLGISVGPLTSRVSARQLTDAVGEARCLGIAEVHVLGWAFEANVGEVKSELEKADDVAIQLVMIRPDALAEGLKVTKPSELFSPLALPEIGIQIRRTRGGEESVTVTLKGVGLFNRATRRTAYYKADSGYIAAWYLDEDYDGDCFVDCQMFFDFKKAPNLSPVVGHKVDPEEFELKFESEPFEPGKYRRVAVKVVDVYGNESTVVRSL